MHIDTAKAALWDSPVSPLHHLRSWSAFIERQQCFAYKLRPLQTLLTNIWDECLCTYACLYMYMQHLTGQCWESEDNHSLVKGTANIAGIDKHDHPSFPGGSTLANKVALEQLSELALPEGNKLSLRLSVEKSVRERERERERERRGKKKDMRTPLECRWNLNGSE